MILRHFWKSFRNTVLVGILILLFVAFVIWNLGRSLVVQDTRVVSDLILVPSGGGQERIDMAIDLYKQGFGKKILVSGKADDESSPSNAESMYNYSLRRGVPETALIQEPNARNTWENILFARDILTQEDSSILLVTSSYHMKRLKLIAENVFPGKNISSVSVSVPFWDSNQWWKYPKGAWLTVSESMKILLGKWGGIWYALK